VLQEFPDTHAPSRFRRTTTPKLVDIIVGDFVAQQAGRYELKEQPTPLFGNTQTLIKAALIMLAFSIGRRLPLEKERVST
jgi:hypothetical protein